MILDDTVGVLTVILMSQNHCQTGGWSTVIVENEETGQVDKTTTGLNGANGRGNFFLNVFVT